MLHLAQFFVVPDLLEFYRHAQNTQEFFDQSLPIGIAKISIKVFHISAVKFEKPSPVAILTGRRPRSLEIFIVSARFCIISSFTLSNIP